MAKATELFEKDKSQAGMALVARILIGMAADRDKGSLYKKAQDFINQSIDRIEKAGTSPIAELFLCRAELMLKWRVLGRKGGVSWIQVRDDLLQAQKSLRFSRDPIWTFFLAVAHYQLADFPQAEALFASLRTLQLSRIIRNPFRCLLVAEDGTPKTFQGIIKLGGGANRYIDSSELGADLLAKPDHFTQQDDATVHFRVAFSMLGSLAVSHLTDNASTIRFN